MTILFIGNTPSDVAVPMSTINTATPGRDAAYSPSALLCFGVSPTISIPVDAGTEFWFHLRMVAGAIGSGSGQSQGQVFRCLDGAGVTIFDLFKATNTHDSQLRVFGSSTVLGPVFSFQASTTYLMDFRVVVGASGGTILVEMYVNNGLVAFASATNSGTVKTQPRSLIIEFPNRVSSSGFTFSEFLATSDEPTVGARVATLEPVSAGALAAWTGTVASLADGDTATGIESIAAGQRFTSIFSAYGGATSPAGVRGLFLKSLAAQSGLPPSQIDQFVRIATTNYDGALATPSPAVPLVRELLNNPDTGLPWNVSAFAALEAGFRAGT